MDRFAESMIARGPTLDTNRETATGSLHVLALPSVDAAREFVAQEPNNRRCLRGALAVAVREPARTFDVGVLAASSRAAIPDHRHPHPRRPLSAELLERLILYGALTTLDHGEPAGVALALQAPDREAVTALIEGEPTGLGASLRLEIHDWEFGGRR